MAAEGLGGRHMELLKVLYELGMNDPDSVADMDKAAQRVGLPFTLSEGFDSYRGEY